MICAHAQQRAHITSTPATHLLVVETLELDGAHVHALGQRARHGVLHVSHVITASQGAGRRCSGTHLDLLLSFLAVRRRVRALMLVVAIVVVVVVGSIKPGRQLVE
jgi:hypothetical protein